MAAANDSPRHDQHPVAFGDEAVGEERRGRWRVADQIPAYYQASHPSVVGRLRLPLEANVPIGCGGALVMPGEVIVGDAGGVLVPPAALAEQVAHDALAQESREACALERLQAGASVRGVDPLSDARRGEFEAWMTETQPHGRNI